MKSIFSSVFGRSVLVILGLVLASGCASTPSYSGPPPGDTDRDGLISEAEYSAEIARIRSETDASHARTRKIMGLDP